MAQTETVKVTSKCRACGKPMHLWQDSTGSGWMHDTAVDEYNCHRANITPDGRFADGPA